MDINLEDIGLMTTEMIAAAAGVSIDLVIEETEVMIEELGTEGIFKIPNGYLTDKLASVTIMTKFVPRLMVQLISDVSETKEGRDLIASLSPGQMTSLEVSEKYGIPHEQVVAEIEELARVIHGDKAEVVLDFMTQGDAPENKH